MGAKRQVVFWCLLVAACSRAQTRDGDQEEAQDVAILKQINRVNEDGSYTFGYEAADGSFKIETRDVQGNVKGMFGFIDASGELKRVTYSAKNGTGFQASGNIGNSPASRPTLTPGYSTVRPPPGTESSSRRPYLILRHPQDTTSDSVIQHIPRRTIVTTALPRPTTTPVYGEYIQGRRPIPNRSPEDHSIADPRVTEEQIDGEPVTTTGNLRRITIAKRPIEEKVQLIRSGKNTNQIRRQLGLGLGSSGGDTQDVYAGSVGNPRLLPQRAFRQPPRQILATLDPRDVYKNQLLEQNNLRPEIPDLRSYLNPNQNYDYPYGSERDDIPPYISQPRGRYYPEPYPVPAIVLARGGTSVVDEQQYPVPDQGRRIRPRPDPRALIARPPYRPMAPEEDLRQAYPIASFQELRDEIMAYLLRYLQVKASRLNPYLNGYNPQYPSQYYPDLSQPPPGYDYQYPNVPYSRPNLPFYPPRVPPFQGNPYPIQNLPFSNPNVQYESGEYQQSTQKTDVVSDQQPQTYIPKQAAVVQGRARAQPSPTVQQLQMSTSDTSDIRPPPSELLRMLLNTRTRSPPPLQYATTTQSPQLQYLFTSTTAAPESQRLGIPVRSVQILGATVSPLTQTTTTSDEMQMDS